MIFSKRSYTIIAFPFCCGTRRGKRRRANRRTVKSFFVSLIIASCFLFAFLLSYSFWNGNRTDFKEQEIVIDLTNNYFQSHEKLTNGSFLVNTEKCKIPDLNIWEEKIRPLVGAPTKFKCSEAYIKLTYVDKDVVVINEDALKSVNYALDQITCCYNMIERVEQNNESYNLEADNVFRFSEECIQMEKKTKPKRMFIKVTCTAKGFFPGFFKYTNFHMIAMLPDESKKIKGGDGDTISEKMRWWKDCLSGVGSLKFDVDCKRFQDFGRPPNILVLGWDSTSRSNFHRFMYKTKDVLENVIKPVEMLGYNKVGENTFPNFVALMSSLTVKELVKTCFANSSVPQDNCPHIWKQFSDRKYLTAHLEDAPNIAIFNYFKTGFVRPPVDIYPRPFMLAAYEEKGGGEDLIDCIGYQRPEEMILNYIVDLAELAQSRQIPYFLTSWLTDLTHFDMNNLQLADAIMARTLQRLSQKGLLDNTVLLVMSDHGYRFLDVRTTTSGWYEDKLPTLWIMLPPAVVKVHWKWVDALQYNSRMLTTPFDIHEAFIQILTAYWTRHEMTNEISRTPHSHGVSPFTKVPSRSCNQAEIPPDYCACIPPTGCRLKKTLIKRAAKTVVQSINVNLPSECTPLKVSKVTACGLIQEKDILEPFRIYPDPHNEVEGGVGITSSEMVVVTFRTRPGNFLFEAIVQYNSTTKSFPGVLKLMRMNKQSTSTFCLVKKDSWIELLCYCNTVSIFKTFTRGLFFPW